MDPWTSLCQQRALEKKDPELQETKLAITVAGKAKHNKTETKLSKYKQGKAKQSKIIWYKLQRVQYCKRLYNYSSIFIS